MNNQEIKDAVDSILCELDSMQTEVNSMRESLQAIRDIVDFPSDDKL